MAQQQTLQTSWVPWALTCLAVPLVLLLIEVIRGARHETQMAMTRTMQTHLESLQSEAIERAKGLEVVLSQHSAVGQTLAETLDAPLVRDYWQRTNRADNHRLYSAIVDQEGAIVLHNDPSRIGRQLDRGWYDRRLLEYGANLAFARQSALDERPAYDVSVPLHSADGPGEYHEAIEAAWLDARVEAEKQSTLGRWAIVLGLVLAVDVAAGWSLSYLTRFYRGLRSTMAGQSRSRARELSQIGAGLAHEVRNPLHALRINLHTLRRAIGGRSSLPPEQLAATIDESDGAIDRLDELMRDLLQYSDPTAGQRAQIDLVHEMRATLRLLSEDFRRDNIRVEEHLASEPLNITIDPNRLRQLLLSLLTFAQHRAGKSGVIDVSIAQSHGGVELSVSDSGPVLPEKQRQRLFEPFQAPVETGSGLGLALVQVFVEEVGGRVNCDGGGPHKDRCRVWFPLDGSAAKGGPSL